MKNILLWLGKKKRLRFYDILSIVSISIYASKISNERIFPHFMNVDILKTFIYLISAGCIYLLYSIYQDYISIHEEVYKVSVKPDTKKSYDNIYNETVTEGEYKKNLSLKLILLVVFIIMDIGLWFK